MEISKEKLVEVISHFWENRNSNLVSPVFLADAIESASKSGKTAFSAGDNKLPYIPTGRDWIEDTNQENGNYENECSICSEVFYGNKHRFVCKLCTTNI